MNLFMTGLERMLKPAQLAKLRQTTVGVAGLGGLGSNVAGHLVRSGFCRLVLADFDRVEPSNLNRQAYFPDQVGLLKTEALAANLLRINPELKLELCPVRITNTNVNSIFGSCQIWVEAFDQATAKKMIVEAGLAAGKQVISASGLAGWGDTDAIRTIQWRSGLAVVGDFQTAVSVNTPPLSPRVGVAAGKEANLVLTRVLGDGGTG